MARRRSDDWVSDALLPRLRSKSGIAITLFWLAVWGNSGFQLWTGFGLFFAWGATLGLFSGKKNEFDDSEIDDDRGYRKALGSETEDAAAARRLREPESPSAPPLLHCQIIVDAAPAKVRLEASASVAEGVLGERLRNMVARVKDVEGGLEQDPSRLSDVQRLFTYYLPATADLLTARGANMGNSNTKRLAEIDAMIGKLDLAYTDFADRLKGHDARSLEIDLRLLESALNEELSIKTKA
jgi:hypothetical protein